MREIKKTFIYSIKAVFPSKKALLDFIKDKSLINGKYLIAGSNAILQKQ